MLSEEQGSKQGWGGMSRGWWGGQKVEEEIRETDISPRGQMGLGRQPASLYLSWKPLEGLKDKDRLTCTRTWFPGLQC